MDLDGVLVLAHSDKQDAAATWKKTYGHHPLMGFVDHSRGGTGEPVAALLRPGNAGSNTAADDVTATRIALAQLPNPGGQGLHRSRDRHPRPGPPSPGQSGKALPVDTRMMNALIRHVQALGERTAAELKERWRALKHVSLGPSRIGDIARAARVLNNHWK